MLQASKKGGGSMTEAGERELLIKVPGKPLLTVEIAEWRSTVLAYYIVHLSKRMLTAV
jgi:hypothetical protein